MTWSIYRNQSTGPAWLNVPTGHPYSYERGITLSCYLEEGDFVTVTSALEGTNDLGYNVMFADYLKESPDILNLSKDEGTILRRPVGINITPDMHHGVLNAAGFMFATETRAHNVTHVVYAASTAARPEDKLQLQYTDMSIAVHRETNKDLRPRVEGLENGHPILHFDETEFS